LIPSIDSERYLNPPAVHSRYLTPIDAIGIHMPTDPEREILALLAEHGATPAVELAERLDRHPVTVDRHCYDLESGGHITMTATGGVYRLTPQGRRHFERLSEDGGAQRLLAP
jgi:predicted ArsR family transcriptional regulator